MNDVICPSTRPEFPGGLLLPVSLFVCLLECTVHGQGCHSFRRFRALFLDMGGAQPSLLSCRTRSFASEQLTGRTVVRCWYGHTLDQIDRTGNLLGMRLRWQVPNSRPCIHQFRLPASTELWPIANGNRRSRLRQRVLHTKGTGCSPTARRSTTEAGRGNVRDTQSPLRQLLCCSAHRRVEPTREGRVSDFVMESWILSSQRMTNRLSRPQYESLLQV